jgi:hypothetical protein
MPASHRGAGIVMSGPGKRIALVAARLPGDEG